MSTVTLCGVLCAADHGLLDADTYLAIVLRLPHRCKNTASYYPPPNSSQ